jgi:hypothetical protein
MARDSTVTHFAAGLHVLSEKNPKDTMKAPVKAGREWRMQGPHEKTTVGDLNIESCTCTANCVDEAIIGAHGDHQPRGEPEVCCGDDSAQVDNSSIWFTLKDG